MGGGRIGQARRRQRKSLLFWFGWFWVWGFFFGGGGCYFVLGSCRFVTVGPETWGQEVEDESEVDKLVPGGQARLGAKNRCFKG